MNVHYASAKLQARMDGESLLEMARSLRMDNLNCEAGNKACGKRCIPQDQQCKTGLSGKTIAAGIAIGAGAGALGLAAVALASKAKETRDKNINEVREYRAKTPTAKQVVDPETARRGKGFTDDLGEAMKSASPTANAKKEREKVEKEKAQRRATHEAQAESETAAWRAKNAKKGKTLSQMIADMPESPNPSSSQSNAHLNNPPERKKTKGVINNLTEKYKNFRNASKTSKMKSEAKKNSSKRNATFN